MESRGSAGSYVGGNEGRPLPTPDLSIRTPGRAVGGWTCPRGCGFRARRETFHLCSAVEPLADAQVERKFTPAAATPEVVAEPPAPKPDKRIRAKVAKGDGGVVITLTGPVTTVLATAVLTGLLEALNRGHAAEPPTPPRKRKTVPSTSGRGKSGGRGGSAGKLTGHDKAIIERYEAGALPREIAADYECTPEAIRILLKRNGVELRSAGEAHRGRRRPGARALTPEQEAECVRLYLEGDKSLDRVAELLGCGATTVRRVLGEQGVTLRAPGQRATTKGIV